MREFRTYGSVRGAPSNGRPCRDAERIELIAVECPVLVRRNGRLGSFAVSQSTAMNGGSAAHCRRLSHLHGLGAHGFCMATDRIEHARSNGALGSASGRFQCLAQMTGV